MKKILYTQRVDYMESYGERRDAADQRLPRFLAVCGLLPVAVPNVPDIAAAMFRELSAEGLFFSGGNDLDDYGGKTPEREQTERMLLELARERRLPVFGICHGMQLLLDALGAKLVKVENHVRTRHSLSGELSRAGVNSFHNLAAVEVRPPLRVLARTEDGAVEAVQHESESLAAVMWHPEREASFVPEDIEMVRKFFGV